MKKKKTPKIKAEPNVSKIPRNSEEPANYKRHPISWQLGSIDSESNWGIQIFNSERTCNLFWTDIYPKIKHFEAKTWHEIEKERTGSRGKSKHHSVNISDIIPDAQKRLEDLKLDDIDSLFSMRLTGEQRIWGIRNFSYMQVLWFDLKHEICPSKKKHT